MANWVSGGRSTSTIMRSTWRATTTTATKSSRTISLSRSIRPNLSPRISPIFPRLVRREMSSLLPLHTAIASASLVSKLPTEANTPSQARFANYVSPI